jgi:hypothetical protein
MSLIDSVVFRDIFGTEPTRRVWSDGNRTHRYFDIEAAIACAEATVGVIPARGSCRDHETGELDDIDFEKLRQETEKIGYPVFGCPSTTAIPVLIAFSASSTGERLCRRIRPIRVRHEHKPQAGRQPARQKTVSSSQWTASEWDQSSLARWSMFLSLTDCLDQQEQSNA